MILTRGLGKGGPLVAHGLGLGFDALQYPVWDTDQGTARNLARNLARYQIQDCRVQVLCEPTPAGSTYRATVRTTARAMAIAEGMVAGATPLCRGTTHAEVTLLGYGAECGAASAVDVAASSGVATTGFRLRVGGGRIRAHAGAHTTPIGASALAGSPGKAEARGVKNPTDEEMVSVVLAAIRKRRLTPSRRRR